jgi:HSP20 family protein
MATKLMRLGPRSEFALLRDEMDRMFRQLLGRAGDEATAVGAWLPRVDVEETDEAYVVHAEVPGVNVDDIAVRIDEDMLIVDGERRFYEEKDEEGFRRIERSFGAFHRALRLPGHVESRKVSGRPTARGSSRSPCRRRRKRSHTVSR